MASFLNISERAAIALHAVGALARCGDKILPTKNIASLENVSEAHLAKVLRQLANAGIVTSTVGPGGGFVLARPADELTLLEIFELIDGPVGDTFCILTPERGNCMFCIFMSMTEPVNTFVRKFLSTITVADMANPTHEFANKLRDANLLQVIGKNQPSCIGPHNGGNHV